MEPEKRERSNGVRIIYQGACFPLDAYSMRREDNKILLENIYKDGRVIIITCLMGYRAERLMNAIRRAYKDGEKIYSVDDWFGRP